MDFTTLEDGFQTKVPPSALIDFKFGNKRQARNPNKANELRQSIKSVGILQNIISRPHPDDPTKLEILGGYGRRDMALEIGLDYVPVVIKQVDDRDAYIIHLAENTIRSDLTMVDEARAAQEFSSLYEGDRQAIADYFSWPIKKVNELLELMRCSENVLNALNTNHIKPGHALALAPFTHRNQDINVERIIANKLTVGDLKELVGKVQLPLNKAKFDTSECNSCVHNTYHQMGLLDDINTRAKCAKPACYREKTTSWLQGHPTKSEVRF
jgi:PRTRC genetic system ParB family protein